MKPLHKPQRTGHGELLTTGHVEVPGDSAREGREAIFFLYLVTQIPSLTPASPNVSLCLPG